MADGISPDLVAELAPTGRLRTAINFGNAVLAQQDPAGGPPRGVSAELARELALRLGVGIDYVTFDAAGKVFEALKAGLWDIAFLAIDPVRAGGIDFTAPYVMIEGTYLVPKDSALRTIADVDRDGVRVAVAQGSAYDLYLTRALKHAKLVRQPSGSLERHSTRHLRVPRWPPVMRNMNSSGIVLARTPVILAPVFEKLARMQGRTKWRSRS